MSTRPRPSALLILIGTVCLILGAGCDSTTSPGELRFSAEEPFSFDLEITTQTEFLLLGVNGQIEVTAADGNRVSVSGTRRVESDSQEDADRRLEDLNVETGSTDEELSVRTRQPSDTEGRNYIVDYTVVLPGDFAVTLANVNGALSVSALEGGLIVGNVNGEIVVEDHVGDADINVINGRITAEVVLAPGDRLSANTVNGGVRVVIPDDTSARVVASLTNGSIDVSCLTLTDLVSTPTRLTGTLGSGEGRIDVLTVNGSIDLVGYPRTATAAFREPAASERGR